MKSFFFNKALNCSIVVSCLVTFLSLTTKAQHFIKLKDFNSGNGTSPRSALTPVNNFLYGTAESGGSFPGDGTIYRLKPDGTKDSVIHTFYPQGGTRAGGGLYFDGTYLYGMTQYGGVGNANGGTIYKILPDGSGYAVLFNFDDFIGFGSSGRRPQGALISDGTYLYGMTEYGGYYDKGTLFKILPNGSGFTKLIEFNGSNGLRPRGSLIYDGTYLYGMTPGGGSSWNPTTLAYGYGTIFRLKPDGSDFNTLFSFSENTGYQPVASLLMINDKLYGTTLMGNLNMGFGGIFSINKNGSNFTNLKVFSIFKSWEGGQPATTLTYDGVYLYGACPSNGPNTSGLIYKLKPDSTDFRVVHNFLGGALGSRPMGDLYFDGTFMYGTTNAGGNNDFGIVYKGFSLSITTTQTIPASCSYSCNGIANVKIERGFAPYKYLWSNGQTTPTATGLCVGRYTVVVTDSLGSIDSSSVIITSPSAMRDTITKVPFKCSGSPNGSATVTVTGGTPPYTYLWSNGQQTSTATALGPGVYVVSVTDSHNCTISDQINHKYQPVYDAQVFLSNIAAVDEVGVDPSFGTYYDYDLPNNIQPHADNPLNLVNPGKHARFKIQSKNLKSSGQSIVSGNCVVRSNSEFITITDSTSNLNNIAWNGHAWSSDEFEVYIHPKAPVGSNLYFDFIVNENANQYSNTCLSLPLMPLVYSTVNANTVSDDNNGDSKGNNNGICDNGETIEFYPLLNSITDLNAKYVKGTLKNIDNHTFIEVWNNRPGANGIVHNSSWWNYAFGKPKTIPAGDKNMTPEFDFVFDVNDTIEHSNFNLYLTLYGGFNIFPDTTVLTLIKWAIPFRFNQTGTSIGQTSSDTRFSLFPNPTSGQLFINLNKNEIKEAEINIYNTKSQLLKTMLLQKPIEYIRIDAFEDGVYFIELKSNKEKYTQRVILQR